MQNESIIEEFYSQYFRKGKDLYKKLVTLKTKEILEIMEKDKEFIGSAEPYVSSLLFFIIIMSEPKKILEIGTLIGYSTLIMADALAQNNLTNSKIITVDPDLIKKDIAKNYFKEAELQKYVKFIDGSSLNEKTYKLIKTEAPFDLLFIDSIHNYNHTKKELETLTKLVRKNGFIICHDSGVRAQEFDTENLGGVRKALLEYTKDKKNFIFLDPPNWAPIGCFFQIKE